MADAVDVSRGNSQFLGQAVMPTNKKLEKLGQVKLMSWHHCLTDELAEELADSSANIGFLD